MFLLNTTLCLKMYDFELILVVYGRYNIGIKLIFDKFKQTWKHEKYTKCLIYLLIFKTNENT